MTDTRATAGLRESITKDVEENLTSKLSAILDARLEAAAAERKKEFDEMLATFRTLQPGSGTSISVQQPIITSIPVVNNIPSSSQTSGMNHNSQAYSGLTRLARFDFPRFNGSKVKDWLFRCERFFLLDRTPDELKIQLAAMNFEEQAISWHQSLVSTESVLTGCWKDYRILLLDRFGDIVDDPMADLKNLHETDGIVAYNDKFETISNRLQFPEAYLLSVYLAGLRQDTQMHLRMFQPKTVRQCFMLGKFFEAAHPRKPGSFASDYRSTSPASPTYQVFDEMLEPIDDSAMSLNSPELLPEEVHHQTEVRLEGYGTPIFPSKIAISSPPCPSSVQSSKIQVLSKDPVDIESTTPYSVNLKFHTAVTTELSTTLLQDLVGLDSCALEAKQIDDCESLQPFEMVIGISAELLAYFSAHKLFVSMSPWSNEVLVSICGLPSVLTCFMKSSTASFVCMAEILVFDPGGFKPTDLELLVALGAHDLFVELPQRDALWSTMKDWTFLMDNVLEFIVEHFPYDRGKYKLFMSSTAASKELLTEFLGLGFHLDSLGILGSLTTLSHPRI